MCYFEHAEDERLYKEGGLYRQDSSIVVHTRAVIHIGLETDHIDRHMDFPNQSLARWCPNDVIVPIEQAAIRDKTTLIVFNAQRYTPKSPQQLVKSQVE
jgi:hypothetical protein